MAVDATGTPTTSLGIPKFNTAADIPSGKGFNAAMDFIDDLLEARAATPAGIASGEAMVWNGTTWVRSSVTKIAAGNLAADSVGASEIAPDSITNAEISPTAAISLSKVLGRAARIYTSAPVTQTHNGNGTGAYVELPFDLERFDAPAWHDNAVNNTRVIFSEAMIVAATFSGWWQANTAGIRNARVAHRNSAGVVQSALAVQHPGLGTDFAQSVTALFSVAATDYITADFYQNSGGILGFLGGAELSVWRVA